MKKLLLTLVVSFAICGSMFAQYNLDSHWPDFYYPNYMFQSPFVAGVTIDGVIITHDYEGWDELEFASFITNAEGEEECRGNGYRLIDDYVLEYGDPFPIIDGYPLYYTEGGDVAYFKMYDHSRGIEYTDCTVTYLGEPYVVYTGVFIDQGWDDPENPVWLNFTTPASQTFTKDIVGYGDQSNPGGYYLIASPIQQTLNPTQVNHMTENAFDLYYFNQDVDDDHPWINYKVNEEGTEFDADFTIVPFKGYLYANSADVTLEFTGTPYEGDGIVELDYVEEKPYTGWNLIGNPYALDTAYLIYEIAEDDWWFCDFYILDDTTFRLATDEESYIEPMCGVLIEATDEVQTVKFDIDASKARRHALNMTLTRNSGDVMDVARLRFNNGRNTHKFQLNPSSTKVYFTVDNEDYAVVNAPEMGEMPVSFKAESNGNYSLNFVSEEVSFNYLHLIDNMTGADVDLLATPSYSFDAKTTDYASRFKLVFATGSNSDDSFAFFSNGSFVISNEGEATLQVVDVTGRILSNKTINGSASVHVDAAPGVYMLRLINGDNVKVQKVVVK